MDRLTPQERLILETIKADPLISQQALGRAVGMARSTVAAHLAALVEKGHVAGRGYLFRQARQVICVGGAAIDRTYRAAAPLQPGTSNPVTAGRSFGGVARNVCETLIRLGVAAGLASVVGHDDNGQALLAHLSAIGADVSQVAMLDGQATAEYVAILDAAGDLALGLANMSILDAFDTGRLARLRPHLAAAQMVFADCNLSAEVVSQLTIEARRTEIRLFVDAVSAPKVARLPADLSGIDVMFLNLDEAQALTGLAASDPSILATAIGARGAAGVALTLGGRGVCVFEAGRIVHVPAMPADPVDVTGAGDALIAGTISRLAAGDALATAVRTGCAVAALTVEAAGSGRPDLSPRLVETRLSACLSPKEHP